MITDHQTTEERLADIRVSMRYYRPSQTTEERLADIRVSMRYYRPSQTFGREHGRINGWYYTEPVYPLFIRV